MVSGGSGKQRFTLATLPWARTGVQPYYRLKKLCHAMAFRRSKRVERMGHGVFPISHLLGPSCALVVENQPCHGMWN